MFIAIGLLIIAFAIGMAAFISFTDVKREAVTKQDRFGNQVTVPASPPFIANWTYLKSALVALGGVAIMLITGCFFYNPAGTATSVQYLTGGDKAVTSQGVKLKWWGKTIPISFEIAMQDYLETTNDQGEKATHNKEEGIYYRPAQRREFADAIKADIAASLIVSVDYTNEELFLDMADKNRSEEKLVYARIYPVYEQALKNTCKLMDAQDYISGASSQFDYYLKDQMEHGMYMTEESYDEIEEDVLSYNIDEKGDTLSTKRTVATGRVDNENRQKKYKIKLNGSGEPVRDASNSLRRYGLTVVQAAVTNIDWEQSFDDRLKLQKEQVAQTQLEKQEAEKEYYATQKAIAKGEREKAEVRVTLEKSQLEVTIAAETRAKEASYKELEETNLLAAAKKTAERIRVSADADAYEIKKKVTAGITPEVKLQMELDAKVATMKALAGPNGITLPTTVFGGSTSGKSSASMLESILGAKILSGEISTKK